MTLTMLPKLVSSDVSEVCVTWPYDKDCLLETYVFLTFKFYLLLISTYVCGTNACSFGFLNHSLRMICFNQVRRGK